MSRLRKLSPKAWETLQLGAGVLLCDNNVILDDYQGLLQAQYRNIIGATSGGVTISIIPEYFNNAPQGHETLLDLAVIRGYMITITGTVVSQSMALTQSLLGAFRSAYVPGGNNIFAKMVVPKNNTKGCPQNIWWVGDHNSDGGNGYVAIHMKNAISSGGFVLTTSDTKPGTCAFSFQAWASVSEINSNDAPCEILFSLSTSSDDNGQEFFPSFFVTASSAEDNNDTEEESEEEEEEKNTSSELSLVDEEESEESVEEEEETAPYAFFVRLEPQKDGDEQEEDVLYTNFRTSLPVDNDDDEVIMDIPIFKY